MPCSANRGFLVKLQLLLSVWHSAWGQALFLVYVVFHLCLEKRAQTLLVWFVLLFFPSLEASKLQPWLFLFPFVPDLVFEDKVIMQDSF